MTCEIQPSDHAVVTIRVSGEMRKSDLDQMQAAARAAIQQWGKIRVLVKLEDFHGWEKNSQWGDVAFMEEEGKNIEKMAIVGEDNWRILVEAFTAKGFRSTAIEYFLPSERDRVTAWLGEKAKQ